MKLTNPEFLNVTHSDLPEGASVLVAGFKGDPNNPKDTNWWAEPYTGRMNRRMNPELNTYYTVASFKSAPYTYKDGREAVIPRRCKDQFAALHVVMIDDLGSGLGAKMPLSKLAVKPTALIETSPDNYQAVLKLKEPEECQDTAQRLIKAMIKQGLLASVDPGMDGVTRVGRLPNGINGKPKYGGFNVRMAEWNPELEYTVDDIIDAYSLDLDAVEIKRPYPKVDIHVEDDPYIKLFYGIGMLQATPHNGVVDIECPWIDEHTDRADTGTAYFIGGGFKCHHGHCEDRTIHDVNRWLFEQGYNVAQIKSELNDARSDAILAELRELLK